MRDGAIILCTGKDERPVARLADLPLTHGGRIGFQVENLLAAVAAGHALGLSLEAIRTGIETFTSDLATVPGRFNVLTHKGAAVILDYGHNSSALLALCEAIEKMPHRRRKIVYTAAGDRRDEDILRQAEIIGDFFDDIYIYEDKCTRGRPDGEIMRLMRQGFGAGKPGRADPAGVGRARRHQRRAREPQARRAAALPGGPSRAGPGPRDGDRAPDRHAPAERPRRRQAEGPRCRGAGRRELTLGSSEI